MSCISPSFLFQLTDPTRILGRYLLKALDKSTLWLERKRYVNQAAGYKAFLNEKKDKDRSYKRAEDMLKYLKTEIEDINNEMKDIIEKDESLFTNYKLLTGIKGVADVNAINTIIFTNNFKNFQTARQYACYIGIAF
jgi:transposase